MTRAPLFALFALLFACGGSQTAPTEPLVPEEPAATTEQPAEPNADPATSDFKVEFETTVGRFVVQVHREWAPIGAQRFYELVKDGYYTDIAFFRVIEGFMVQFGIHGDPAVAAKWKDSNIEDDPVNASNMRGRITFATAGPGTRTTQLFINYVNNERLDGMGFAPFGEVIEGMDVVEAIHSDYGEGAPAGRGPDQGRIQEEGNQYLRESFPGLDYILRASIVVE